MDKKTAHFAVTLPEQKNYDITYNLALQLAAEKLGSLQKLEEQCQKSASVCITSGSGRCVQVKYLGRHYQVSWPEIDISMVESREPVGTRDKILILDYLNSAQGTPLSGVPITFQESVEVSSYHPTFSKRAIKPLIDYFGNNPERLLVAARELGGIKAGFGDFSVTIPAFDRVPISLVIWKGDEEFPPNANILFDKTIHDYLTTEAIIVLCQVIAWRLVNSLPTDSGRSKS